MQLHNALRKYTSLLRGFRAAFGEDDRVGVERLSETLQPVMDFWSRPEWAWLSGRDLFSDRVSAPAVAAEFSFAGLRNPAGSGLILVCEGAALDSGTTMGFTRAKQLVSATDVDGTATLMGRDTRNTQFGGGIRGNSIFGAGGAIVGVIDARRVALANTSVYFLDPIVLAPGTEFRIYGSTANIALFASFWGSVRSALPSELL